MAAKKASSSKSDGVPLAFDFLQLNKLESSPFPPIVIAFGEDDFLRSRCLEHAAKLGAIEPIALRKFEGDELDWRELNDELSTRSLFDSDGTKGALVRRGDKFLTSARDKIEKWIEREEPGSKIGRAHV